MNKIIALVFALFLLAVFPASATISTLNNSNTLTANGATNQFSFNFPAVSTSDIQVVLTNASGLQTTLAPSSYLIALNPIATGNLWSVGGSVTYPLSGSPLASGNSLTITRVLPLQQTTDISNQGDFYPTVVEQALDTGLMQTQQVNARTGQLRGTWLTGTLYNYGDMVSDGANGNNTSNIYLCAIPNTSGTWSTDLANGEWSLALNVQSIVNSLPQIANNQVFGNISGGTATPIGLGVSALIDSAMGSTQGSILYRSGSLWTPLTPGTNGQVLSTQGAAANPKWTSVSGSGTVTSVGSGTGLTGGPITGAGNLSLATIANNSFLANASGGVTTPSPTTISAFLDSALGSAQGSIVYRGGTVWNVLAPGSSGQALVTQGAAANPIWQSISAGSGSLTQNGYQNFAGGLLIQWGFSTPGSSGLTSIVFPIPFPANCFNVQVTVAGVSDGKRAAGVASTSTTGFSFYTGEGGNGNQAFPAYWMAIGN